jgi:hypothetical protein
LCEQLVVVSDALPPCGDLVRYGLAEYLREGEVEAAFVHGGSFDVAFLFVGEDAGGGDEFDLAEPGGDSLAGVLKSSPRLSTASVVRSRAAIVRAKE